MTAKPEWEAGFFDEAYFGKGGRGGFTSYRYDSPEQREQLALKWNDCQRIPHRSVLFVGCATGFEVAWWHERGKLPAFGVDVSEWAIAHLIPQAQGRCFLFDGQSLSDFADQSVDLVAAFDVLTLVPDGMIFNLVQEMKRVARVGIVFRTIVKNWRNLSRTVDGQDGAVFRYRPFTEWDRMFTSDDKFKLHQLTMSWHYETVASYLRAQPGDEQLRHLAEPPKTDRP
ncbi:MAG: class I SAM-dependent methyltransferase [Candidatus Omnitrophica bacterium]|nr:class I SAM-dependent methyltransferase [Candidatus Omnitrophota bacterium]